MAGESCATIYRSDDERSWILRSPHEVHWTKVARGKIRAVEHLRGRVAVVTGAASGIGRALAERFAAEGMRVVLADIEADALARAEADLRTRGARVLAVRTDVQQASDVETLAQKTLAAFG